MVEYESGWDFHQLGPLGQVGHRVDISVYSPPTVENGGVRRGGYVAVVGPVAVDVANGSAEGVYNAVVGCDCASKGGNIFFFFANLFFHRRRLKSSQGESQFSFFGLFK